MTYTASQRLRGALFASTALLALPAAAFAQDSARPSEALDAPHASNIMIDGLNDAAQDAQRNAAARASIVEAVEMPEITINNNFTPTDARDPVNINGIGQIVSDGGGGSVGLCTGSLINPRVVLFAAHCVNTRAATAYGAGSGGVGIAVGFETNTRANAAGQPDELVNWLLGAGAGPGQFQTNRAQQLYNIEQVFYNPASLAAASCTGPGSCFLEADIATAVLDAPTRNVPTWALLFSPLATPSAINPATGTGYHVAISGYGRFGTGTTGQNGGNDFRRRAAENMLGALTSINERNLFLFGTTGTPSRPQLLYWLDFDDPARGTAAANPRDFNGFRDNALPREGSTGPGDSGGPLILDQTFSKSVILGVLSGGSTFFAGQPGGSYGTQSFYQPLFLYWDWIVANNPYRYVTANAGNRNWEDATAWVTTLDPAYNIISGGQLVNGVPTELGGTIVATTPQFGEVCFQSPLNSPTPPATNECQNLATGAARNNVPNTPSGSSDSSPTLAAVLTDAAAPDAVTITDAAAAVTTSEGAAVAMRDGIVATESPMAAPGFRDGPLPAPTIANGLPGATNFVPNNVNGVRATGVAGRYYDVTLRNAGIVTLSSAVTVDRFTVLGASSQLTVNAGASLTSLIDVMHSTGIVQNNGTITTGGDYLFTSGLLGGTGRVNTPFLTSVLGNFAPGTMGTVGTLTIGGNLVMASGSTFAVDLGPSNTSDRLAVVANGTSTGAANVGGRVVFSAAGGNIIRNNDLYTILTATGGVTGTFSTTPLSAILTPQFVYTANTVQTRIVAGSYSSVVANTPVQRSFAALLDRNRGGTNVGPLYDFLDLQNAGTIQATLESWAPRTETLKAAIGTVAIDNMSRFFRSRLAGMDIANGFGGQVATLGNPLQAVSRMSSNQLQPGAPVMSYGQDSEEASAALPDTVSVFFAGGYLDGKSASMATAIPFGGDDNYDGYYAAAGIESELGDNAGIGFGLSYTDIDGTTSGAAQNASGKLYQGTLYGKLQSDGGIVLDTQVSAAMFSARTDRTAVLGPTTYRLQSKDDILALSAEVGLGKTFEAGSLDIGPRIAMRASRLEFTPTTETGGPNALQFDRGRYDSLQGLAGLTLSGGSLKFRPYASAYYVHEFQDKPASFGANFVGGVGLPAVFALTGTDTDWFEASAGIAFGSETFEIALGADTTIGRNDVSNQSYRGTVTFRF